MRKRNLLFAVISMFIMLTSCMQRRPQKVIVSINGRPLTVEIARTPKERQKGLMNRQSLGYNEGMIFIFKKEEFLSFWMKNTGIPLSIAFIDKSGKVVDLFDMKPYSLEPVVSTLKCKYAIEANRGFFTECGLKQGDIINLEVLE